MFKIGDVVYLDSNPDVKGRITDINDYYIYVKFNSLGHNFLPVPQYPYKYRKVDNTDIIWSE